MHGIGAPGVEHRLISEQRAHRHASARRGLRRHNRGEARACGTTGEVDGLRVNPERGAARAVRREVLESTQGVVRRSRVRVLGSQPVVNAGPGDGPAERQELGSVRGPDGVPRAADREATAMQPEHQRQRLLGTLLGRTCSASGGRRRAVQVDQKRAAVGSRELVVLRGLSRWVPCHLHARPALAAAAAFACGPPGGS